MAVFTVCFLYLLVFVKYNVVSTLESNGSRVRANSHSLVSGSTNNHKFSELKPHAVVQFARKTNSSRNGVAMEADPAQCPPWWHQTHDENGSIACECDNRLGGVVKCTNSYHHYQTSLLPCFCMTYAKANPNRTVVGFCLYACFQDHPYYDLPQNSSNLNDAVCTKLNRKGQLCGSCEEGYAPPAYSYALHCVNCTEYGHNWVKYTGIVFAPITVFFGIVIVFRVSLASPLLNAFVLVCQTVALPQQIRTLAGIEEFHHTHYSSLTNIFFSLYGIGNMDFFRMTYKPFCLHPKMTSLHVLAMDYITAVYPLVLIMVTYLLVILYDHGYRLVVFIMSPFHKCFFYFRNQWNIKTSLIDTFATFLLLSYVKLLNVSFDLLVPTKLHLQNGKIFSKMYLYYDATVEMFGPTHLPYAITAILVLLVFVLLPLLLLCLYPMRCFHRSLNYFNLRCFVLHAFMDVFQGCYKDGTSSTYDCRYFAGVYLMVRIVLSVVFAMTLSIYYYPIAAGVLMLTAIAVIVVQPYKNNAYNILDATLILFLAFGYVSFMGDILTLSLDMRFQGVSVTMVIISILIPVVYSIVLLLYWILVKKKLFQKTLGKVFNYTRRGDSA